MKYLKALLIIGLALVVLLSPLSVLAKKRSLTLWGPYNPGEFKVLQDMIGEFEARNPGMRVDYEALGGPQSEQQQRVMSMALAGALPDVLIADISMAAFLAEQEAILPLEDKFIERVIPAFIPETINAFRFGPERRLYGVPKQFQTLALFYNEGIFTECGIEIPTSDWSWRDLATVAEQLYRQASIPGVIVTDDFIGFFPFGIANGILKEEGLISAAEALRFYINWRKSGWIIDAGEIGLGWAGQGLVNDRAAMAIAGSWLINFIEETRPDLIYGAIPLPAAEDGAHGNLIYADAYLITERAGRDDSVGAAQQLIEFLSQESQERWFELGLGLPSRWDQRKRLVERYPVIDAIYRWVIGAEPYTFGLSEFPSVLIDSIKDAIASGQKLSAEQAQQVLRQALKALPQGR